MAADRPSDTPIDVVLFTRNREQFPEEQLVLFWGLQVAWDAEGRRILATGATHELLHQHMQTAGIDPTRVVVEFIPDPNVAYL